MSTSTTPLIDQLAIAHLDFQPGCVVPDPPSGCPDSADFLITVHLCIIYARLEPVFDAVLVCSTHLEGFRRAFDYNASQSPFGKAVCLHCNKPFSKFTDLVPQVTPL